MLLPRAELRDAQQSGGVEAIEAYVSSHPNSKIPHEVQAALKGSLLAGLEEAKKKNTLAALSEFEARYGKHGLVEADVEKARRDHLGARPRRLSQADERRPRAHRLRAEADRSRREAELTRSWSRFGAGCRAPSTTRRRC